MVGSEEEDRGEPYSHNKGPAPKPPGDIITRINGDDILEPVLWHSANDYFEKHPDRFNHSRQNHFVWQGRKQQINGRKRP